MQETRTRLSLWRLMLTGASALIRPPFRTLVLVECLITLVATGIPVGTGDAEAVIGALVLLVISAILQIAILLAAAQSEPDRSADRWILGAFRKRSFWRFALTRLVVRFMILLGVAVVLIFGSRLPLLWTSLTGLGVGLLWGFLLGSVVGVAEQAAVLERRWPFDAMGRSGELTRRQRRTVGIVFALLVVAPNLGDRFFGLDLLKNLGAFRVAEALLAVLVSTAGLIALTKAYIDLGGGEVAGTRR
jgi:hypothetical protein